MSARSRFIPPCIPTLAYKVPSSPDGIHEVKHDGYRLQVRRVGDQVRPSIRRGYDWCGPLPVNRRHRLSFTLEAKQLSERGQVAKRR
jgi:ATP-dependent DNA ligase